MSTIQTTCQVCGQGQLIHRKRYRLGGVAAFIGFLFLIGSLLGLGLGVLLFVGTGPVSERFSQYVETELRERFEDMGTSQSMIEKIMSEHGLSEHEVAVLTPEQKQLFDVVEWIQGAGKASKGIGVAFMGGLAIVVTFFSLIGLVIGILLTLRKQVLECSQCRRSVNI